MRRGHFIIREWEIDYQIITPPNSHVLEDKFLQEEYTLYNVLKSKSAPLQPGNIRNHDILCLGEIQDQKEREKMKKQIRTGKLKRKRGIKREKEKKNKKRKEKNDSGNESEN